MLIDQILIIFKDTRKLIDDPSELYLRSPNPSDETKFFRWQNSVVINFSLVCIYQPLYTDRMQHNINF